MLLASLLRKAIISPPSVRLFTSMPQTSALVILAEGAEEMEAVISIDILRRGGVEVSVASLSPNLSAVKCHLGTLIVPSVSLPSLSSSDSLFDAIVLPGGPGSELLAKSDLVGKILHSHLDAGRLIGAICAGPIALAAHKIPVKTVTSHPKVHDQLVDAGFSYSEDPVVSCGNIITSRGPGTAFAFALKLLERLEGKDKADSLVEHLML